MAETAYMNGRGETVVPYHVFREMSAKAIDSAASVPYPRHSRSRCRSCKCFSNGKPAQQCKTPKEHSF